MNSWTDEIASAHPRRLHDRLDRGVDEEVLVELLRALEVVPGVGEDGRDERVALAPAQLVGDRLDGGEPAVLRETGPERTAHGVGDRVAARGRRVDDLRPGRDGRRVDAERRDRVQRIPQAPQASLLRVVGRLDQSVGRVDRRGEAQQLGGPLDDLDRPTRQAGNARLDVEEQRRLVVRRRRVVVVAAGVLEHVDELAAGDADVALERGIVGEPLEPRIARDGVPRRQRRGRQRQRRRAEVLGVGDEMADLALVERHPADQAQSLGERQVRPPDALNRRRGVQLQAVQRPLRQRPRRRRGAARRWRPACRRRA